MLQFILASTFFLAFSAELFAQSAAVVEAAKKEGGKVVAYGSLESEAFDAVKAGFEKKTRASTGLLACLRNQDNGAGSERVPERETAL